MCFFLEGNLLVPCQHAKEEQCKCLTSALLKNLLRLDTKAESRRLTPTVNGSIWIRNPSDQGSKASDLKWALKNLFKFNDTTSPSDPPDQVQNLWCFFTSKHKLIKKINSVRNTVDGWKTTTTLIYLNIFHIGTVLTTSSVEKTKKSSCREEDKEEH